MQPRSLRYQLYISAISSGQGANANYKTIFNLTFLIGGNYYLYESEYFIDHSYNLDFHLKKTQYAFMSDVI